MQKISILNANNSAVWLNIYQKYWYIYYENDLKTHLDSTNDFILTCTIEFSIKSYINSEIPMPWQKNSVK